MDDVKIRVTRRGQVREITRKRIPPVGSYVKVNDQPGWLVVATEYPLKHKVNLQAA